MNMNYLRLCLITNTQATPFSIYKKLILQAAQGGVTLVQLREKSKNLNQIRQLGYALQEILRPFNIPLIVNDYVEIAKEIDAAGVHLGQSDFPPTEARKILGPSKIIGWSIESLKDVERANKLTCINYIGASAIFKSKNKSNCKNLWGLDGLKVIAKQSLHPVIAIGGINLTNIKSIMECGISGVAVIDAIHHQVNPTYATRQLIHVINQTSRNLHA